MLEWAGANFDRLLAVAKARDYRPEWIGHQIADHPVVTQHEAEIIARMTAQAGPFLSQRLRWVMREIKVAPMSESDLASKAKSTNHYREYKRLDLRVRRDLDKLEELGLVRRNGALVAPRSPCAAAR